MAEMTLVEAVGRVRCVEARKVAASAVGMSVGVLMAVSFDEAAAREGQKDVFER